MAFLGTYNPKLDNKGRLAIPAKYRPQLEDGLVVCRGQTRCLYVFPQHEFDRITAAVREAPVGNEAARNFARNLFAHATDDPLDAQGRVLLPVSLRSYARLERDCVVVGVGARLEIWSATAWTEFLGATEDDYANTSEEVLPGVF